LPSWAAGRAGTTSTARADGADVGPDRLEVCDALVADALRRAAIAHALGVDITHASRGLGAGRNRGDPAS
jgi:hypothetical protein